MSVKELLNKERLTNSPTSIDNHKLWVIRLITLLERSLLFFSAYYSIVSHGAKVQRKKN